MKKVFNRARQQKNPPRWNLRSLYAGVGASALLADQKKVARLTEDFQKSYEGTVGDLSGEDLGRAIEEFEHIEAMRQKIFNYAILLEAEDRNNFSKTQPLKKWAAGIEKDLMFFNAEIVGMKESDLMTKLVAPRLAQYAPWLARQRDGQENFLSTDIVKASNDYKSVNTAAWLRLYAETIEDLRVKDHGELISLDELENRSYIDGNPPEIRAAARQKIATALKDESGRVAFIYNVLMQDMAIDADLKKYTRPDEEVHRENGLDSAVVDTMFSAVKESFIDLSHSYYAWKAQKLGCDSINMSTFLDMPHISGTGVFFTWSEAKNVVLRAFRRFSPKFNNIAGKFFDERHIDAQRRARKDLNPFMLGIGPGTLPFILLGYSEDMGGISGLSHELGHGIHQVLAEKEQGVLLSNMPTDVAETASIFAEMLVFEELLRGQKKHDIRQDILDEKVSSMLANALQQLSYYDFERRVHAERKKGILSAEQISDIWVETQKEYYGPAIELDDYDRYFWMLVPHFFEMPFYVHSYSFAQLAVSALFVEYKKALEGPDPREVERFRRNYIQLLETGMTKNFHDMFSPFGLNPALPEFWQSGLSLIRQYLSELIAHDAKNPSAQNGIPPAKPRGPGL